MLSLLLAALVAAAAQAQAPSGAAAPLNGRQIPWKSFPDNDRLAEGMPEWSEKFGDDGGATIECTVADEALADCTIVSEQPDGSFGFGHAALALTPLMKPATTGAAAPLKGRRLRLAVRWAGSTTVQRDSCWAREIARAVRFGGLSEPQRRTLEADFAARLGKGSELPQMVNWLVRRDEWLVLNSDDGRLTGCRRLWPAPASPLLRNTAEGEQKLLAFVAAGKAERARQAAELAAAKVAYAAEERRLTADASVIYDAVWEAAPDIEAPAIPGVIEHGRLPAYHHKRGETAVVCRATASGTVEGCVLQKEIDPHGLGLGRLTLGIMGGGRLKPLSAGGEPVAGRQVRLRFGWGEGYGVVAHFCAARQLGDALVNGDPSLLQRITLERKAARYVLFPKGKEKWLRERVKFMQETGRLSGEGHELAMAYCREKYPL